ncbi:MAG TPA: hypothetical protein VMU06_17885 [Stellaceae bacterium]|nr:hypothetical protein [Stellaceae bacterium]
MCAAIAGFTFRSYTALCTVALNLAIAVVLTPVFRAMRTPGPVVDDTVPAGHRARDRIKTA